MKSLNIKLHELFISVFIAILLVLTIISSASNVLVAKVHAQNQTPDVQSVKTSQIQGEVLRINDNSLTIRTDDGETKEVSLSQNIAVERNTMDANFSEIRPGDNITVTQTQDGDVLSVQVLAGEVIDWAAWIVPLVIAGIIIAALTWWIASRANKTRIKATI